MGLVENRKEKKKRNKHKLQCFRVQCWVCHDWRSKKEGRNESKTCICENNKSNRRISRRNCGNFKLKWYFLVYTLIYWSIFTSICVFRINPDLPNQHNGKQQNNSIHCKDKKQFYTQLVLLSYAIKSLDSDVEPWKSICWNCLFLLRFTNQFQILFSLWFRIILV